jgi:hypothetical protein
MVINVHVHLSLFRRIIVRANTGFQEFSFTGCIRNIIITDYIIDLNIPSEDVGGHSEIRTCTSCIGDPCGAHGNCISQADLTFRCACFENFVTDLCKFRGTKLNFTCSKGQTF